ncbi:MAG: MATE family efflux transporter, partial [Burkholderiales bacterium]|nr:MATE family efflux transporter [Burkholderiales bacterium]
NSLGSDAMAGSARAFIIEINIYCFINAYGLAATTFVSQNWGAGRLDRCRKATWISFWMNLIATSLMIGVVLCFGGTFMSVVNDNEHIIALGMIRIWIVVVPQPICVLMETLSGAMRGYGYSLPPALVTLTCVCVIRVLWVWTAFAIDPTFICLMWVYPLSWLATAIGLSYLYWRYQQKLEKRLALRISVA